jgi:uncharacterized protein YjbJ (UPF0337 family)
MKANALIQARSSIMAQERNKGKIQHAKGTVREAIGKATGRPTTEVRGKAEKAAGRAREAAGRAREDRDRRH